MKFLTYCARLKFNTYTIQNIIHFKILKQEPVISLLTSCQKSEVLPLKQLSFQAMAMVCLVPVVSKRRAG